MFVAEDFDLMLLDVHASSIRRREIRFMKNGERVVIRE
jgi:hypothetical protein